MISYHCIVFFSHTLHLFLRLLHRWRCQDLCFPLFISHRMCHLMVEDYSHACQRERGKKKERRRRKKPRKKPLCCDRDLNPRTLSPQLSLLSIRPRRPAQHSRFLINSHGFDSRFNSQQSQNFLKLFFRHFYAYFCSASSYRIDNRQTAQIFIQSGSSFAL